MTDSLELANKKTLRVAAVQISSENGRVTDNIKHATGFVEEAAQRGAKLILLPEFMPTGYIFTDAIWEGGEPSDGPTVKWMKETSKKLDVWLGTSFLEAAGEDFYNTFVLTNPKGEEDGRVRKQTPAGPEACFNRGEASPHVINSQLGKIGVAICYDNYFAYTPINMHSQSVDMMLQPHSHPIVTSSPKVVEWSKTYLEKLSTTYAKMLGIPVVFCNKSGQWRSPIPGIPSLKQDTYFAGLSSIADSNGAMKAQLGSEEGVIVEDVILDPALKKKSPPKTYGRWSVPDMPFLNRSQFLLEAVYNIRYQFSKERKRKAREISLLMAGFKNAGLHA